MYNSFCCKKYITDTIQWEVFIYTTLACTIGYRNLSSCVFLVRYYSASVSLPDGTPPPFCVFESLESIQEGYDALVTIFCSGVIVTSRRSLPSRRSSIVRISIISVSSTSSSDLLREHPYSRSGPSY